LFGESRWLGLLLLTATMLSPIVGLSGLIGVLSALLISRLAGFDVWDSKSGILAFNSLLICLAFSYYIPVNWMAQHIILYIALLVLISTSTFILYIILNWILSSRLHMSSMSLSFSVVAISLWLFLAHKGVFASVSEHKVLLTYYDPILPAFLKGYFHAMGSLFFMPYTIAGLFVTIALVLSTRIGFILSLIGWSVSYVLLGMFHIQVIDGISYQGFNLILVFLAMGGIFLLPGISAWFYALIAAIVAFFITIVMPQLNPAYSPPVFALPFNLSVIFFVFALRLRLNNSHPYVNDWSITTPEKNLEFYLSRMKRFSRVGVPQFSLPVNGEWLVTQGFHGALTHKYEWAYAWDLEIQNQQGKRWRDNELSVSDYFAFGKPVMVTADGTVVKVVDSIEDNVVDSINTKYNWGNYVSVSHGYGLYSLYAHLKHNSISVKPGEYIRKGDKIGLVGNSGRSPRPHLHFHVQLGIEAGSKTKLVNIVNYKVQTRPNNYEFVGCDIPKEGQFISSIQVSSNLQEQMHLQLGQTQKFDVKTKNGIFQEDWIVDLDFLGAFRIYSSTGTVLEFSVFNGVYNALNIRKRKLNSLFAFAILLSRLPDAESQNIEWKDTPSLSVILNDIFRNLYLIIAPIFSCFKFTTETQMVYKDRIHYLKSATKLKVLGLTIRKWSGQVEIEQKKGIRLIKLDINDKNVLEAKASCA
jgi:urea transporter